MRFTIIRQNFIDKSIVIDFIKNLLGVRVKIEEQKGYLVIFHNYDSLSEIESSFNTLSTELVFNLYLYNSQASNQDRLYDELALALAILDDMPVGCYDLKKALLHSTNIPNKKLFLDYILDSTGVNEEFIKGFIQCDLNVSKASKILYIHRNTMLYKLDKLKELSDFDLRCFLDAYIVYSLIENK